MFSPKNSKSGTSASFSASAGSKPHHLRPLFRTSLAPSAMPYRDASFDVVVNSMSFHHYPNPIAFFREVARVLKPGGRLILRDGTSRSRLLLWYMNKIEIPILNRIGYGDVKLYSLDEARSLCETAGLAVETLECRWPFRLHLVARSLKSRV